MHLLGQRTLGIAILLLLGIVVITKRMSTGSIIRDKPEGNYFLWLIHAFNLFFLLIANPLAAISLVARRFEALDPTHVVITIPWLVLALETVGLALYPIGCLLMAWALTTLGRNYQVGGSAPRTADKLIVEGPYRLLRHPMYTAALCISLGLACLVQSLICLAVHLGYVVLILLLIPIEEQGLRSAYGQPYDAYRRWAKALVPFVF